MHLIRYLSSGADGLPAPQLPQFGVTIELANHAARQYMQSTGNVKIYYVEKSKEKLASATRI